MKILFSGHDYKYEIEALAKLFVPSTFTFHYEMTDTDGDMIMTRIKTGKHKTYFYARCRLNKTEKRKASHIETKDNNKQTSELCLCRLVYLCLEELTGIRPPWGLLTGIRPIKKMSVLLGNGLSKEEAFKFLKEKYMVSDSRLELSYLTSKTQSPLIPEFNPKTVSIYISIPFCPTRCSYCSFVSHSIQSAYKLIPDYINCLSTEIALLGKIIKDLDLKVDTVYIGGGTPTSIAPSMLQHVTDSIAQNIDLSKVREYSIEAGRADTITEEKLKIIKNAKATRISVNPQTMNDEVLKAIGRNHTAKDTLDAFYCTRNAGFDNINMDLIAGLPKDTPESFSKTLDEILKLSPESITVHALAIKRSASLYQKDRSAYLNSPAGLMLSESIKRLPCEGYLPYYLYRQKNTVENLENIGFSKPDRESLYNIFIMDETQTILGAGCAASTKIVESCGRITRIHNYKFPYEYVNRFNELMEKKNKIYEILSME